MLGIADKPLIFIVEKHTIKSVNVCIFLFSLLKQNTFLNKENGLKAIVQDTWEHTVEVEVR